MKRDVGFSRPGPAPAFTAGAAAALLLVASLAMLAVLAYVGTWLTFWSDEWSFLFKRADPSAASLLRGSDVHLHLFVWLIYQALFRLVGLTSYYPYLLVAWAFHLACVWLLFGVAARLAGWGFGLVAGLSLLFLGSGFEVLLQPGQMGYTLSEATGLLALLLLARGERTGRARLCRVGAGVALCVAVASSGVGMIFVGLVLVWAVLRRDRASLLAALPAFVLFGVWFPIWSERTLGRLEVGLSGVLQVPAYMAYGVGATVTAVLGLPPYRFALVGVAIAIAAVVIVRRLGGRFDALALAALAALLAEFALVAGFRSSFGIAWTSRSGYLHPAVAFLWLIAGAVVADERFRLRPWLRPWVVAPVLSLAILGNMTQFTGAARGMRVQRAGEIAYLRLLQALRDSPDLDLDAGAMLGVRARNYFTAIDRFGVPRLASSEPSLADPGRADRHRLDEALVKLVGRGIRPVPGGRIEGAPPVVAVTGGTAERAGGSCVRLVAGEGPATGTWTPGTGAVALQAGTPTALRTVRVGVFASPGQPIESARAIFADGARVVRLPVLPGGLRWSVQIDVVAGLAVTVCSAVAD